MPASEIGESMTRLGLQFWNPTADGKLESRDVPDADSDLVAEGIT